MSADLEDELIRALGVEAVEAVIEAAGEAHSLRLLAGMPAQRDWTREAVLRRFLGVRSGRKARYAALLVEALELGRVPECRWRPCSPGSEGIGWQSGAASRQAPARQHAWHWAFNGGSQAGIGPVQQRRPGSLETTGSAALGVRSCPVRQRAPVPDRQEERSGTP